MVAVIDPSAFARGQIRALLVPWGCEVVELAGDEPLPWLAERLARARVLVVEPASHGAGAAAWLARLKAACPAAALVVCTALTTRAAVVAYRRAGAADVIAKPWSADRLGAAIGEALGRRAGGLAAGRAGSAAAAGGGDKAVGGSDETAGGQGNHVDRPDPIPSGFASGDRGGRLGQPGPGPLAAASGG